jgi:multidrug efflux pump subunit AcrA (membrane-fusion protein)
MKDLDLVRARVGFVLAVALGTSLAGCAQESRQAQPGPLQVATNVARVETIRPSEILAGIVAPYQNVAVQSTLSEPADLVAVQEGDRVKRGQLLAQLDVADLRAQLDADIATASSARANTTHTVYSGTLTINQGVDQLRSAETAVAAAQQTLKNDQANLARDQQLVAGGFVAQQTVDQQETLVHNDQQSLQSAQASLAAARSNVQANGTLGGSGLQASTIDQARAQEKVALAQAEQIRVQIAKATILSPIDGVVVNRNLNPSEYPGTRQIFTIQQVDPVYAILRGSGNQIAPILQGARVHMLASDAGGLEQLGKVVGVLNQIVPGSTDFEVKVLLSNPRNRLRPGMAIEGNVALPSIKGVAIPATAFTDDTRSVVMTVDADGTVHEQNVRELGTDDTNAIVSGLATGTRVITNGQIGVGAGQKVASK